MNYYIMFFDIKIKKVEIKPLTKGHLDKMLELQNQVLSEKPVFITKSSAGLFNNTFKYEDNFALGLFDENILIGFCTCSIPKESRRNLIKYLDEIVDRKAIGHLNLVLILPAYRGRGYATELVNEAISTFKKKSPDIRIILSTVWIENNNSIKMMQNANFESIKQIEDQGRRKILFKLKL